MNVRGEPSAPLIAPDDQPAMIVDSQPIGGGAHGGEAPRFETIEFKDLQSYWPLCIPGFGCFCGLCILTQKTSLKVRTRVCTCQRYQCHQWLDTVAPTPTHTRTPARTRPTAGARGGRFNLDEHLLQ